MQYLTRMYFFNPVKDAPKKEIYVASSAIDFLTWYKKESAEGTMLHLNTGKNLNQVVDALPENVNQLPFDGLFFKCTCHIVVGGSEGDSIGPGVVGGMKKYSAWLNTDLISMMYSYMPDDVILFFRSGQSVLVCARLPDLLRALLEHGKKYKERKKDRYGKREQ
jgi:hypothetical protein